MKGAGKTNKRLNGGRNMGIVALGSQISDLAETAMDVVSKLFDHLDPEETEAKLSGVIGDIGLKSAKFGGSLQDAISNVFEHISLAQADKMEAMKARVGVDPSTIDIGDEYRAAIEKRVSAWEKDVLERRAARGDTDDFGIAGAAIFQAKSRMIEDLTSQVQLKMAKEMEVGNSQVNLLNELKDKLLEQQGQATQTKQRQTATL